MLYDPKWKEQTEVRADPFALSTLVAWLEARDPAQSYDYGWGDTCILAQYFSAQGFENPFLSNDSMRYGLRSDRHGCALPAGFNDIANAPRWDEYPLTFGGALRRARASAVQMKQP